MSSKCAAGVYYFIIVYCYCYVISNQSTESRESLARGSTNAAPLSSPDSNSRPNGSSSSRSSASSNTNRAPSSDFIRQGISRLRDKIQAVLDANESAPAIEKVEQDELVVDKQLESRLRDEERARVDCEWWSGKVCGRSPPIWHRLSTKRPGCRYI